MNTPTLLLLAGIVLLVVLAIVGMVRADRNPQGCDSHCPTCGLRSRCKREK